MSRAKFICLDCGVDTGRIGEFYMLHDDVWLSVVPDSLGMLCVGCIESRLGRQLQSSDFNNSFVNNRKWNVTRSDRLTQRMIDDTR